MRKLLTGLLFVLPLYVLAEVKGVETVQIELACFDTTALFKELRKEYEEEPLVYGEADDVASSTMSLWTRKDGVSWTIIATKKDISCIVGVGRNLKIVRSGKTV